VKKYLISGALAIAALVVLNISGSILFGVIGGTWKHGGGLIPQLVIYLLSFCIYTVTLKKLGKKTSNVSVTKDEHLKKEQAAHPKQQEAIAAPKVGEGEHEDKNHSHLGVPLETFSAKSLTRPHELKPCCPTKKNNSEDRNILAAVFALVLGGCVLLIIAITPQMDNEEDYSPQIPASNITPQSVGVFSGMDFELYTQACRCLALNASREEISDYLTREKYILDSAGSRKNTTHEATEQLNIDDSYNIMMGLQKYCPQNWRFIIYKVDDTYNEEQAIFHLKTFVSMMKAVLIERSFEQKERYDLYINSYDLDGTSASPF